MSRSHYQKTPTFHRLRFDFSFPKRFDVFIIAYGFSKVSTKSVPFLSQFFLKKVSEKSHGENTVLIRYAPQKITAQFVTHLSVMIEFSREMRYNDYIQEVREVRL